MRTELTTSVHFIIESPEHVASSATSAVYIAATHCLSRWHLGCPRSIHASPLEITSAVSASKTRPVGFAQAATLHALLNIRGQALIGRGTRRCSLKASPYQSQEWSHHTVSKCPPFRQEELHAVEHAVQADEVRINDHQAYTSKLVLTCKSRGQIDGTMRFPSPAPGEKSVPVHQPTFLKSRLGHEELRTTWLGHACHYTEFPSGLRVLFDPVLEDRCSPLTFAGPKRYTQPACAIADLPFLDAVVISHSHYDHLSLPTIKEIKQCFPEAHFFVGLGLAQWFRNAGVANVTELDWWEDSEVSIQVDTTEMNAGESTTAATTSSSSSITATFSSLPAQHSSARSGFDADKTLWCSWAVTSPAGPSSSTQTRSVYFGGDTGYRSVPYLPESEDDWGDKYADLPSNPDFKKIGDLRGPFDLGLLPIGAYLPRYLMSSIHADPRDAVEIFRDTRCRRALAIHWGAWPLTTEPCMEPPQKLRAALRTKGMPEEGVFDICDIGDSKTF